MSNQILPNVKEPVKDRCKNSRGFTLAELLIVIAIIGVLVAVSIPIFNAQMEKARRAVDLHTARSIESALAAAYNMGDIQLTKDVDGTAKGLSIYVMICRDPAYAPKLYNKGWFQKSRNPYCWVSADKGVLINGVSAGGWGNYNNQLATILKESGLDPATLRTRSNGKEGGWDWIVILVGAKSETDKSVSARIFSGMKGQESGYMSSEFAKTTNNIEKLINGE